MDPTRARRFTSLVLAGVLAAGLCACGKSERRKPAPADPAAARIERGAYLTTIMDCGGCHTPGALAGQPDQARKFAGSDVGFEQAGGAVVYPPNLTPHATGLAGWSEADILNVLRSGVRPDGRQLAPIMPWQAYSKLADEDAVAIAAYLKSLTPVDHRSPAPANTDTAVAPYLTVKTPLTRPVPGGGSPEPVSPVNPPP